MIELKEGFIVIERASLYAAGYYILMNLKKSFSALMAETFFPKKYEWAAADKLAFFIYLNQCFSLFGWQ